jgi:hypothetical protein
MFDKILGFVTITFPLVVKTDFEMASIVAIKDKMLNVQIFGCLFTLSQNIQIKIKELNFLLFTNEFCF